MNSQFLFKNNENWLYRIGKFLTSLYCKCCCKNVLKNAGRQSWSPCCGLRFKATQNIWKKLQRDWHRAVRRSERPPRSTKAEVINWWSADNFAFELNNSCIVGTNIFVWMPSLFFTYKVLFQIFWVVLKQSPQQGDQDWRPVFFKTFLQQHLQYSEVRNFHTL